MHCAGCKGRGQRPVESQLKPAPRACFSALDSAVLTPSGSYNQKQGLSARRNSPRRIAPVDRPKYSAFLSYSHRDAKWGSWLHKAMEAYRLPKPLVGTATKCAERVPKRLAPIFRDREELAQRHRSGGVHQRGPCATPRARRTSAHRAPRVHAG